MSIVSVSNLQAHYRTRVYGTVASVRAVDGVSIEIDENIIYGIAGESGCGKTTLMKTLFGMITPPLEVKKGSVTYTIDGKAVDILALKRDSERRRVRGRFVSYVPQGSMSVLNPVRRINSSFRDFVGAHRRLTDDAYRTMVRRHLHALGLEPDVLDAYPHQLSGGMKQRVTIALATILEPKLILADEPTTALDVLMQRGVVQLLKRIKRDQKNTIIMVTHDMAIHANMCDRVAIMYAGQIVEDAAVQDIFRNSVHPYTRVLLGSLPVIGDKEYRVSASGAPPSLIDVPPGCRFHPRCADAKAQCSTECPPLVEIKPGHRVACFV